MNTRVKSDEFLFMERCFAAIKNKVAVDENLRKLQNAIKRVFDLDVEISISENTTKEFYGMMVFPEMSTIDRVVEAIVTDKSDKEVIMDIWANTNKWYIEIDSILLYDISLNANPSEMVAVLLHEIGHIVYSNSIPYKVWKILRYKTVSLKYTIKQLAANRKIRKLFNIAIIEACCSKNYEYFESNDEKIADEFVVRYGYGKDLEEFISKLIKTDGNKLINRTEEEQTSDVTTVINWSILNIKELEFRKKNLRNALKVELIKTPSKYIKSVIQSIFYSFFGSTDDQYRILLSESVTDNPRDVYSEIRAYDILDRDVKRIVQEASGNIFDKQGRLKKITQSDVDILAVECERIESVEDKIYLLDKLYTQLELVNLGLDYIDSREKNMGSKVSQSKATLVSLKTQLEALRAQILATKIIDKEYGVFIKYPKSYEG